ncbi:MAG: TonB C-terminal domain-containing protein [bacterium]|nr:TonB C-terminal domain-containing protein [bacterium]
MAKRPYHDKFGQGNTGPFRVAVGASVAVHVALVLGLGVFFAQRSDIVEPKVANVKFYAEQVQPAPPEVEPEPEPPKPDPPKPKPPEKKPEPKKEKPKPKPPEKKPEPKKEKKPDPPKPPEKKPDPPKPKKPAPKKPAAAPAPITPKPVKPGVTMKEELPSVLGYWGRLIKRRIERNWRVPGGVRMGADENSAMVSFWVNRKGQLTGEPQIVKAAKDPAIGVSAVRSIKASAPFPPLPEDYTEREVQVIYTFVPMR